MSGDPHEHARRLLHWGRATLAPAERAALDAHLAACAECRAYQAELTALQVQLTRTLHARLSYAHRPSTTGGPARLPVPRATTRQRIWQLSTSLAQWAALIVLIAVLVGTLEARRAATVSGVDRAVKINRLAAPVQMGDRLALLAAELIATTYAPGDAIDLTLRWTTQLPSRISYVVVLDLIDEQGRSVAEIEALPMRGLYPTTQWQAGENVVDRYRVIVPATAAPGVYQLTAAIYDGNTAYLQPTSLGTRRVPLAAVTVTDERPAGIETWADWFGYSVETVALRPGAVMAASLYWRPEAAPATSRLSLVRAGEHEDGVVLRAAPLTSQPNTHRVTWPWGELTPHRFLFTLPDDLPSGTYQLLASVDDRRSTPVTVAVFDVP